MRVVWVNNYINILSEHFTLSNILHPILFLRDGYNVPHNKKSRKKNHVIWKECSYKHSYKNKNT